MLFKVARVVRLVEAPDPDAAAAVVYPDADTTRPVEVEPAATSQSGTGGAGQPG